MTEEEIRSQRERCADCGGALQEIIAGQIGHVDYSPMQIFSKEFRKSIWVGDRDVYTPVGKILAFMCSSCARVYFYGAEKSTNDVQNNDTD